MGCWSQSEKKRKWHQSVYLGGYSLSVSRPAFMVWGGEQGEKKVPIVWTMKVEQSSQRRKMLDAGAELRAERGERGEGRAVDFQACAESLRRGWFLHKPCQAGEVAERLWNPQRLISIPLTTGAASDACREME